MRVLPLSSLTRHVPPRPVRLFARATKRAAQAPSHQRTCTARRTELARRGVRKQGWLGTAPRCRCAVAGLTHCVCHFLCPTPAVCQRLPPGQWQGRRCQARDRQTDLAAVQVLPRAASLGRDHVARKRDAKENQGGLCGAKGRRRCSLLVTKS